MFIELLEEVECECGWSGKLCNCKLKLFDKVYYNCPVCGKNLKEVGEARQKQETRNREVKLKPVGIKKTRPKYFEEVSNGV